MVSRRGMAFAAVAFCLAAASALPVLAKARPPAPEDAPTRADDLAGGAEQPSGAAARLADWIVASDDNGRLPFMIVDKVAADVFAFDADGGLVAHAPVLVGLAPGDDSAPGIGDLPLSAITPGERTTPAGRFVAFLGPSDGEGTVLWVDYPDAISMHPVITTNPKEHRLRRIRSAIPAEHRISFGCINVPAAFFHHVVVRDARDRGWIVYVMPDTKSLADVFPALAALDAARAGAKADP